MRQPCKPHMSSSGYQSEQLRAGEHPSKRGGPSSPAESVTHYSSPELLSPLRSKGRRSSYLPPSMTRDPSQLPNDIDALKAALAQVEAELAQVRAKALAHQKLVIEKLKRELYGPRAERTARILDQMELKLEELESAATEDEIAAERAAAKTTVG